MALTVDVQLNPARLAWPELRDRVLAAERAGYGAVWAYDHLAGVTLGGHTMLEPFTLLGALAAVTSTIELGTLVANINNRTPALLGVASSSVAAISGRRFHLGLGAGTSPAGRWSAEMLAIGQPIVASLTGRHARLVETLDVLEQMWDPQRPAALATFPRPEPRPTVLLGVNSRQLADLAGRRADGVNVDWHGPRRDELLDVAVAARGGRPGFLLTAWARWDPELLDPDGDARRAMATRGIERLILVAHAELTAAELGSRIDSGARPRCRPDDQPVRP